MVFNTFWFVCFSAAFFPIFWAVQHPVARRIWLLVGCAVFHAHFAGPAGMAPVLVLATLTYVVGLTRKRLLCAIAIAINVAALCYYKYAVFFAAEILGLASPEVSAAAVVSLSRVIPAIPPLAISFFVFEFVHYLVEVVRGHPPVRRPDDFLLFALHFPSLVAGPIKRYAVYLSSLHSGLVTVTVNDIAAGATRVGLGAAKKLLLADNLTLVISHYENHFQSLDVADMWLLLAGIAARILLDFSGYSDMAIGLSRMMGVRLPENFRFPYLATSLQDFWQRWHISLTTWIRDYIYIPLGGSRRGLTRKILNGFIVFALCGLWHGPAWHFVLWGLWHGAGLAVNSSYARALGPFGAKIAELFARIPALGWALTLLHVSVGWLLFFYPLETALAMAGRLIGLG